MNGTVTAAEPLPLQTPEPVVVCRVSQGTPPGVLAVGPQVQGQSCCWHFALVPKACSARMLHTAVLQTVV